MATFRVAGPLLFHGHAWTVCLETKRRREETCPALDVPVCSYSLFPSSSFDRLSFICLLSSFCWKNSSLLLKINIWILSFSQMDCSACSRFHRSVLFSLSWCHSNFCRFGEDVSASLRKMLLDVALLPSCKPAEFPWGHPQKILSTFALPAHKNPCVQLNLSRALSGLNRVLLQQTCPSNHLESSPDLSSVGRPKMIPKDQSSSFMRMTKKMWEKRVEQRRMFLYICVSVHVCECLL